jgi:hypothetical protein
MERRAHALTAGTNRAYAVLVEQGRIATADRIATRLVAAVRNLTSDASDLARRAALVQRAEQLVGAIAVPSLVVDGAQREAEFALIAPLRTSDWEAAFHRWSEGPSVADLVRLDPIRVAAAFAATSPHTHLELALALPEVIGALDGAPIEARYAANQILLHREIGRLEQEVAAVTDGPEPRASRIAADDVWSEVRRTVIEYRRLRLDAALARYRAWIGEGRQILLFDPAGDGRVAEVFGDLAGAEHVAVVVPGIRNDLDGFGPPNGAGFRDDGRSLFEAASVLDPSVATIAWLGYDTPDGVDAVMPFAAESGYDDLVRFVDGLVAAGDRHITVVGHSYGSLVAGMAGGERIAADEMVFVGSPGTSLDHAGDVNLPPGGRVWAGLASWDLIGAGARPTGDGWIESSISMPARYVWDLVATGDPAIEDLWHGTNPAHESFGAVEFTTDGATGHSQYFDPGTESLDNLARIAVGLTPTVVDLAADPMELAPGPFGGHSPPDGPV